MQHLHPESNTLLEQTGEGADPRKFVEVPRFRQDQIVFGQQLGEGNFGLVFKASLKIQETREIRAREASSTSTNRGGSTSDVPLMPRKEQVIIEIPVAAKQIKSRKKAIRDILNKCEIKDLFTVENQRESILEKVLQFGGNERMTIEQLDKKATVDSHFIFDLQILETRLNEKELFDEAASFHFLRHPHLVKVFGICEYYADPKKLAPPSPPSMVLEFALKGALDSYVNRMIFKNYKKLDEVVTIQWFYQISDAMAFLHQHNVLHRDLAARNILLTFDLKALVGDFGLAALASQSDKNAELSMNGSMQIPVLWYPYESLFSDDDAGKVYSTKSDVYSFGMLMWEVLTGCPKGRTKFFGDAICPLKFY
ncbi:unnamed protein product [Oikopleura dioica]|uniref:Protein kinase domain-containing protein n=1 Tax=Oikopleura dioica TaxID=34765 RepID=E4YPD8_OIKDI|nr:unnamed protein product [Oikopleura dioica]